MRITLPAVHFGTLNKNGRIYNRESFSDFVLDSFEKKIETSPVGRGVFGELIHDDAPTVGFDVSLSHVSHIVESLQVEDNGITGTIRILDTECGKMLKDTLLARKALTGEEGFALGIRAGGTVDRDNIAHVCTIITVDVMPVEMWSFRPKSIKTNSIASAIEILRNI